MGWFGCKCDRSCNCGKQKGMIRREKVGGREGRGGERRYRYGGFYNGQEGHRVYTFLLRFYACQPVSLGLIVETVGTL